MLGRLIAFVRSRALQLGLLWTVHIALFVVVLVGLIPGSGMSRLNYYFPLTLTQVSLFILVFGLGPIRLRWRLLLAGAFVFYLTISATGIVSAETGKNAQWTLSDMRRAFIENWSWQAAEVFSAVAILALAIFAATQRWLVRIDAGAAIGAQDRQPFQFRLRTLFLLTLGVSVAVAAARFVRGWSDVHDADSNVNLLFFVLWLISMFILALAILSNSAPFWRALIVVAGSTACLALLLFATAVDPAFAARLVLMALKSQLLLVVSLVVLRTRGWRTRWRWQASHDPWKVRAVIDDAARRARRTARLRRVLYALLGLTAGCGLFFVTVVIPGDRKHRAVKLVKSLGGQIEFQRVGPDESLTIKFLKNWLPRAYFDPVLAINLDVRDFTKDFTDSELLQLAPLTSTKGLSLQLTSVSDNGLVALSDWTKLEHLWLTETSVEGSGLRHLTRCTELTSLRLWRTPLNDEGLKHLPPLPNLRTLGLDGTQLSGEGLVCLRGLPQLEELSLSHTAVDDAVLLQFRALDLLTTLDLDDTAVTDVGLSAIVRLPRLKSLSISGTTLTDAGVAQLKQIATLQDLSIGRTQITDAALASIAEFPEIIHLNCSGTSISDDGLANLAELQSLESLNIISTSITDAGLAHLAKIASLRRLDPFRTNVSSAGVAELREKLPDLWIDWAPEIDRDPHPAEPESMP